MAVQVESSSQRFDLNPLSLCGLCERKNWLGLCRAVIHGVVSNMEMRCVGFIEEMRSVLSQRVRRVIEHPSYVHAAVLVPLFEKEGDCYLLFTKRTEQVKRHKGQISFPGGVVDEEDLDLKMTALREAYEEIGLKEDDVQVIGVLDDIVTSTEFIVTPFVGIFPHPYAFHLSRVEIEELIEVPLSFLLQEDCFSEKLVIENEGKRVVYNYQYGRHAIWGATALILNQLLELIPPSKVA